MRKERIIKKLLELGFKDNTYSINNPTFSLPINNFNLQWENGKFTLEGDGGYDYGGTLDLDHLQINDIKSLFKLLTGTELKEIAVDFNYNEWKTKIEEEEEKRKNFIDRLGLLSDIGKFPKPTYLGFLDHLSKGIEDQNKFIWQERKVE